MAEGLLKNEARDKFNVYSAGSHPSRIHPASIKVMAEWGIDISNQKSELIDASKHLILTASHPSPFSAYKGFFGCKHFSKTNEYLKMHHLQQINW